MDWIKVAQDWVQWRLAVTPAMNFCALYRWRTFRIASLVQTVPTIIVIQTVTDSNVHTDGCTVAIHTIHHFGVQISIYSEICTVTAGKSVKLLSPYSHWKWHTVYSRLSTCGLSGLPFIRTRSYAANG